MPTPVLMAGPAGADGMTRVHRPTCKRLPASSVEMPLSTATSLAGVTPAGCCKPQLVVRDVTPDPKVKASKERHARNATPPVVAEPPADAPPELVGEPKVSAEVAVQRAEVQAAAANRAERLRLAKAEHATLQAWIKDGEKPPRPATPNLDAVNAEHAAGGPKPKGTKPKGSSPRTPVTGPYAEALAAKKAGKRGTGKKVSADELAQVAARLRAEGHTQGQALEIAYWLEGLAMSRSTWAKAWEASAAAA